MIAIVQHPGRVSEGRDRNRQEEKSLEGSGDVKTFPAGGELLIHTEKQPALGITRSVARPRARQARVREEDAASSCRRRRTLRALQRARLRVRSGYARCQKFHAAKVHRKRMASWPRTERKSAVEE